MKHLRRWLDAVMGWRPGERERKRQAVNHWTVEAELAQAEARRALERERVIAATQGVVQGLQKKGVHR